MSRKLFVPAVLMVALACSAERDEAGEIQSAGSVDAFTMRVGDCFDDGASTWSGEIDRVPGVPCSAPHDNEVYATFDLPDGTFPGEEEVDLMADEGCYERFHRAIGTSYEESVLMYGTLYPSEASWKRRKDREVVCVAYHMELEKLTGSVIGSGM